MLASTQKAPAVAINGADYNSLRQDVKVNHTHDGVDGVKVDHTDLTSIGVKTHDQIDSDLTAIFLGIAGGIPWTKIQIGRPAVIDLTSLPGGAFRVTFSSAFTRTPIVTCNLVFDAGNNIDKLAVITVIHNVTTTTFDVAVIHPGVDGGNPYNYPFDAGNGWPFKYNARINFIALEPPA